MTLEEMDPKTLYLDRNDDYIDKVTEINPNRALELIKVPGFPWGDNSFSVEEAKEILLRNPNLKEQPCPEHENISGNDIWHIERIKYFINHLEEIGRSYIKVWLHFKEYGRTENENFYYIIWDGNHRLYAAAIAGRNQIKCHFKGSEKFLKALQEGIPNRL